MDIAALSSELSSSQVQQSVGIALMKKTMDAAQGDAYSLLKIMEQSVQPQLGGNLDVEI